MGTPQSLGATIDGIQSISGRLVWVLNRDVKSYKGTFQGIKIEIPPNMEKIPKLTRDGGNLMPSLDAGHFVRDLKEPQEVRMDNFGKPEYIFGPKALMEMELTPREREEILNKTEAQLKKEVVAEEKRAKRTLNKELDKVKNKVAVTEEDGE